MKKCKFCQAEMEDSLTCCPVCGKEQEETEEVTAAEETVVEESAEEVAAEAPVAEEVPAEETPEEPKKATSGKTAIGIAVIVVLVAIIIALILVIIKQNRPQVEAAPETAAATEETIAYTIPADGEPGTVQEKGSYTVSDEEMLINKDTVVATIGDKTLTNGQLQVYYWNDFYTYVNNYYYYLSYAGLDISHPLDVQLTTNGETWQQFFLQMALGSWQQYQAVAIEAEEAGLEITPENQEVLDNLKETLAQEVAQLDVSVEEYISKNFGANVTFDDFYHYQEVYYKSEPYYIAETEKMVPTDAELERYFAEHEEEFAEGGITKDTRLIDVRHILLQPENAQEDGTYADEDWAECEKKAQALLDEYLAGEKTEEAFSALANEHSTDPGSNTNGGLYEGVQEGQMVEPFEEWCFDTARKYGDTGLVRTDYGYHIMYFVEAHADVWKDYAQSSWVSEKASAMLEAVVAEHPMEVSYDKIVIGNLMEQE